MLRICLAAAKQKQQINLDNTCLNDYYNVMASTTIAKSSSKVRFDSRQQEAFLNLWRAYDRLRMLEDALFLQSDLTAQQYNALRILKSVHPHSMPTLTLAARLVSRAPDITRLVDKLATHGWVDRQRSSENRRVIHVSITECGIALIDELAMQVKECHHQQLGHMTVDELSALIALLKKVRAPHEPKHATW